MRLSAQEIRQLFPNATIDEGAEIHKHAIIGDGAEIHQGAEIHKHAEIHKYAEIYGGAEIHKHAIIGAGAEIHKNAVVYGGAIIGAGAEIRVSAIIGDGAEVHQSAIIYGGATICKNAKIYSGALIGVARKNVSRCVVLHGFNDWGITGYICSDGLVINIGCMNNYRGLPITEARTEIAKKYPDPNHIYFKALDLIAAELRLSPELGANHTNRILTKDK